MDDGPVFQFDSYCLVVQFHQKSGGEHIDGISIRTGRTADGQGAGLRLHHFLIFLRRAPQSKMACIPYELHLDCLSARPMGEMRSGWPGGAATTLHEAEVEEQAEFQRASLRTLAATTFSGSAFV